MPRSVIPRLLDIIEACNGIDHALQAVTSDQFKHDWTLSRAVERGLEIISEASRHIPDELKALHPNVPWKQIAGIGNILRHDYQSINGQIIWDTVQRDLTPLRSAIEDLMRRQGLRVPGTARHLNLPESAFGPFDAETQAIMEGEGTDEIGIWIGLPKDRDKS